MKNTNKILVTLLLLFTSISVANAKAISTEEIPTYSYVIGTYLLTQDDNEIHDTTNEANKIYDENDGLTDQALMMSASSIKNPTYDKMVVYYKNPRGDWKDAATGESIDNPENFEITHVNGICIDSSCMGDDFKITFEAQSYEKDVFKTTEIYLGYGDKITSSLQPILNNRPGFKFVCWTIKNEADCFDFNISITDDGERIPEGARELTLEIKWEQIGYNVTYNSNFQGGQTTTLEECYYYDETNPNNCKFALYDSLNIGENTGYRFLGWSLTPNGQTLYQPEEEMSIILGNEKDITLYAIWSARDYQVKYDLDGGTFTVNDNITYDFDSETNQILLFTPTKVGYKFTGWTLNGKEFDGTNIPKEDIVIKANWEEITYSFTYEDQVKTCKYDEKCELDFVTQEKAGQEFLGLYLEDGTRLPSYVINFTTEDGKKYVVDDNYKTIKYTINYDYKGGQVNTSNPTEFEFKESGVNNVQLFAPVRVGYNFAGYDIEGPATISSDNKTLTITAADSVKITAKWTAIEFTFTYNGTKQTCTYDKRCVLNFEEPKEEGKEFKYWYYLENGVNKIRIDTYVTNYTSIPNDYVVSAELGEIEYSILYDYAGGTVSTPNKEEYTVKETSISLTEPTKLGYKFNGWTTSDNAEIVNGKLQINEVGKVTLTASWEPITYTLKYSDSKTQICEYDKECEIKFVADEKIGSTFDYWYIGEGATTKTISNYVTNLTSKEEEIIVKAAYTLNKYRVKYDLDGGTVATENNVYVEYDSSKDKNEYTLENPTKIGYTFKGWSKSTDSNVEISGNIMNVTGIGEIKLVAEWTPVNVTINYYQEIGVADGTPTTCEYDKCTIKSEQPSKEGYIFEGWRTEDGLIYPSNSSITSDESYVINLYAKWTKEYRNEINYELAGGNVKEGSLPTSYVDGETILVPSVEKEGYIFKGWKMNNTSLTLSPEGITEITDQTGNINLVADWQKASYTISFNYNGSEIGSKVTCEYDMTCQLGEHTISDTDFELVGWALEENGPLYYGDNITVKNLTTEAEEIKLYAVVRDLATRYTVNAIGVGSSIFPERKIKMGEPLGELPEAYNYGNQGIKIVKWLNNETDEEVTSETIVTGSMTLKPEWENINYEITYDLVGGTSEEYTATFNNENNIITLTNPTKEEYTFAGWEVIEGGDVLIENMDETSYKITMEFGLDKKEVQNVKLQAIWE